MYKITIVDKNKAIVSLKWSGVVEKKEALDVIPELLAAANAVGGRFKLIVDTSELKLNNAAEEFAEHQKAVLHMIDRLGVVVDSSMTKLQIRKIAQSSKNDKENFFKTYEEAVAWIQN